MTTLSPNNPPRNSHRQRGAAILVMTLILMLGLITLFTFRMDRRGPELEADRKTAMALVQAKEALLGYAAKDFNRPGSLPCADINDDGLNMGPDAACLADVIGRLPWKQLDLPDLRDGNGERLWYAVSREFRASVNSPLNTTNDGQITIRSTIGAIINNPNASPPTGVVAVIIAPGGALTRQGTALTQDRSCTGGGGCSPGFVCQTPYQSVAKCNPANYLDVQMGTEDNANFISYLPPPSVFQANGFIYGPIQDATRTTIANDRFLIITRSDLYSVVTFRMARELSQYAYGGTMGSTISSISNKPVTWLTNQWDVAVDGPPNNTTGPSGVSVTGTITLKFLNCNISYTITGDGNVTRNASTC